MTRRPGLRRTLVRAEVDKFSAPLPNRAKRLARGGHVLASTSFCCWTTARKTPGATLFATTNTRHEDSVGIWRALLLLQNQTSPTKKGRNKALSLKNAFSGREEAANGFAVPCKALNRCVLSKPSSRNQSLIQRSTRRRLLHHLHSHRRA